MSKSIVTLQLGNYSNFIGTHNWNLHEFSFGNSNNNINNDINYYEGLTVNNGVTFTPKLISWDWKENLGPRIIDDIYEEIENQGNRNSQSRREISSLKVKSYKGKIETFTGFSPAELGANKTTEIPDKTYQQWNEYLYARLHPNSLTNLPKLYRGLNSENFTNFSQGIDLTQSPQYRDRMEDQTRYFVEKCDVLQGFQLLCDIDDGFSGVAMNFLSHLTDEYNSDIISFPTSSAVSNSNDLNKIFNEIFLYSEMNAKSVFWSPIGVFNDFNKSSVCFSHIDYDHRSKYESSSILAVALKSLLLPCVLSDTAAAYTLSDYGSVIDRHDNRLASLATMLPLCLKENESLEQSLLGLRANDCYRVLNPHVGAIGNVDSLVGNIFGVSDSRARNKVRTSAGMYDQCRTVSEVMETFFGVDCRVKNSRFISSVDGVTLGEPFPRMFNSSVNRNTGELMNSCQSDGRGAYRHCPASMPVSTVLFSNDSADFLLPIYEAANNSMKSRRMPSVMMGMEPDYVSEAVENFRAMF